MSVADPTDILTNLQLAHIPVEESSELTRGLGFEEVHRLNQKRERIRSPADRLKLFSFSKRHLKLPFSRGKGKKEKHVKLSLTPEKTSPKRKGSKHETRNKRLSRAQAGEYFTCQVVYLCVWIYHVQCLQCTCTYTCTCTCTCSKFFNAALDPYNFSLLHVNYTVFLAYVRTMI